MTCCKFGEPCALSCTGDIVGGCLEPAPTPEPTPAPTLEPMCLITVNTAECAPLIEDQTPVEDCDCYNYCNGELIGCCPYGEFCGVECEDDLVGGCEIEEPEPQCMVSANTGECSSLVETQDPLPDCDCYNYCDGVFGGCCPYGESCDFSCDDPEAVVAGCEVDSVPSPLASAPTPAPVSVSAPTFFFWPDGFTVNARSAGSPRVGK
jgi:hypothetical protein